VSIDAQANLRTLRDVLRFAVTRFNDAEVYFGHGQVDAFEEASFLVMRSLRLPLERLDVFLDAYLTHGEINTLLQQIDQRVKKRVPVAYILKEAWLQGLRFYVDERVIIPRSFIGELLKDELAPWIEQPEAALDILDLCTGSGCLAILAAEIFPNARVEATDISKDALAVARKNVADYGLESRVKLTESDLLAGLGSRRYDVILCNPPYVPDGSMQKLPKEYTYEPELALAGGADGMKVIKRLLREARGHLKRGGMVFVEVGGERATVERQFKDVPMTWLTTSAGDDMVFMCRQEELP
jgi:ribosomal protein L3 glutamine methyltransferase